MGEFGIKPKYNPATDIKNGVPIQALGTFEPGDQVTIYTASTERRQGDLPREPLYGKVKSIKKPDAQKDNPVVIVKVGEKKMSFGARTAARKGEIISRGREVNPNY